MSELNQKIYAQIESWRNRAMEGNNPYVFLDGSWLKGNWGGEVCRFELVEVGEITPGERILAAVCVGKTLRRALDNSGQFLQVGLLVFEF